MDIVQLYEKISELKDEVMNKCGLDVSVSVHLTERRFMLKFLFWEERKLCEYTKIIEEEIFDAVLGKGLLNELVWKDILSEISNGTYKTSEK